MRLQQYLNSLLPGDEDFEIPAFNTIAWEELCNKHPKLIQRVEQVVTEYELLQGQREVDDQGLGLVNYWKGEDLPLYETFRDLVIGIYFSSPSVLRALGEESEPLFPRGQSLPAINFDLLEDVFNRGKQWRSTEKRVKE